jgi:hypothetical protein
VELAAVNFWTKLVVSGQAFDFTARTFVMALPLRLPSSVRRLLLHLHNCTHHPAARMSPRFGYPCDACNTAGHRIMKKYSSLCDQLYLVIKRTEVYCGY